MKFKLSWFGFAALPLLTTIAVGAASEQRTFYVSEQGHYELTDVQFDASSEQRRADGTLYRRAMLKADGLRDRVGAFRVMFEEEDYPEGQQSAGRWTLTDIASRTRYTFTESDDGSSYVIEGSGDVLTLSFPGNEQHVVNGVAYADFQSGYDAARNTKAWREMPASLMFTLDGLLANPISRFGRGGDISCTDPKVGPNGSTTCRTHQAGKYTRAGVEEKSSFRAHL
jgi:hypothetical protein